MKKPAIKKIIDHRRIILLLDFDGTLSPIVSHPHGARLSLPTKKQLKLLSKKGVKIGIVTGRILSDIRKRIGLKDLIYAANHGLEIHYKGRFLTKKCEKYRAPIGRLSKELRKALGEIPNILIEDKGLSVAVHYRLVNRKYHKPISKALKDIARPFLKKYALQLTGGKMVWELRPAGIWNKGKAVMWIWKRLAKKSVPIYIGDDVTDEAVFEALKGKGITIRVGYKKGSKAAYYLASPKEVLGFLRKLNLSLT